ncbi:putative glycolipid-binding domain-containing protein [Paraburkholderia sp. Ac-20340]|uniref:putative glycolipid-binding domain-containing protein n=1 Tax=Paraburkholderia sp. Ac-20340 TaxID=2703888 RepID=UPI00197F8F33|nr:putative glycolipid-binding domain-containing protein [Paraburkholderia sp. Ac-20340]MBN3858289.1 putative glycolipid-binding domain-containing protein [Paraburkholderia sp. Ac-20340]
MREVRWASEEGEGIEHLAFDASGGVIRAESVVVGQRYGKAYGLCYTVHCDMRWCVTYAAFRVMGGASFAMHGDGRGHWRDAQGRALDEIEGCIDIDIAATPYTNTLPMRRLGLTRGERRPIEVAYIAAPELVPTRVAQAYVCIEPDREYRYEGIFRDFTANLKIDADGLVLDYPTLFRRLPALA